MDVVGTGSPTSEQSLVLSGGCGVQINSARAGYLPVSLAHLPPSAFEGIPFYLRSVDSGQPPKEDRGFTLYRSGKVPFNERERERLMAHGAEFVYIRMADQTRFRKEIETHIDAVSQNPVLAISERSAIVYETSVALMNELLAEPHSSAWSQRAGRVSRAITTLVLDDPTAFSHLFAASHHDFYTATHMVNVATYMVPLAYALGYHDPEELNRICQAGLLHDIGKVYISEEILNTPEKLSDEDWALIRRHPEMGCTHLSDYEGIHPLVLTATRQHHERLDGSGYPDGLSSDQIHPVSRICAVVDCFDAMTAFRPFKRRTLSVSEALTILKNETPSKHDPDVMAAWLRLMDAVTEDGTLPETSPVPSPAHAQREQIRQHIRRQFNCPARVHVLERGPDGDREHRGFQVIAHNISQSGLGVLSQTPIAPGEHVRVYLLARAWNREHVDAQTVRCREQRDGWYEIGMQFFADAER